tara:strand:+ start:3964 stop:4407 length:444 start_codon:yes stop_codon:yes gene_type:complete
MAAGAAAGARTRRGRGGGTSFDALASRGGILGVGARLARSRQSQRQMPDKIASLEARVSALEGGGGSTPAPVDPASQVVDTTTAPTASYTSGPVGNVAQVVGGTVGGMNDAVPPVAQQVAGDMMGEQFMRDLSVGAAKMVLGKKINQ